MNHFGWIAAACVALACWNVAQAQPVLNGQRVAGQNAQGGPAARATGTINGSAADAAGTRRLYGDGNGNVAAGSSAAYTTDSGAQGARSTRFKRNDDGSASASRNGTLTTANGGTASRDASYTRNADGSASAERSTSATNVNAGVSYDGSATWTKGEGVSRSGSCKDASGKTVTCGSAR